MKVRLFRDCLGLGAALVIAACGGGHHGAGRTAFPLLPGDARPAGTAGLAVQWTLDLAPDFEGRYVPVERASVAVDALREEIHVASSYGELWTLDRAGKRVAQYDMGVAVESAPVVDPPTGRLWIAGITGEIRALSGTGGEVLWTADAGGAVSAPMVLTDDALFVVTDDDTIMALGREDGEILWRYSHESNEELSIAGRAGLLLSDNRLYTGFTDGVVVALDAGDGRELFRVDTAADVALAGEGGKFVDVDTTPVRIGDSIFVASFAAGLYELDAKHGAVLSRESELVGVTHLAATTQGLVLSSADEGVVCYDLVSRSKRWQRGVKQLRGAPAEVVIDRERIFVGASRGAFLVLALSDGHELARIESAHGYLAAPVLVGNQGFILSNTARLISFIY